MLKFLNWLFNPRNAGISSALIVGFVAGMGGMSFYIGTMIDTGSLADWLSALGTIGAVWFAVKSRTDKAKLIIKADFSYHENYMEETDGYVCNDLGIMEPKYTGNYTDDIVTEGHVLTIYISNMRQSSGLITEWGVIDNVGKKHLISTEPIVIPGFEVIGLTRSASKSGGKYDYAINQINTYKSKGKKFKLYFQDVNDKEYYCDIAERKIINQD